MRQNTFFAQILCVCASVQINAYEKSEKRKQIKQTLRNCREIQGVQIK